MVQVNSTHAHYICRAGYRFESGDMQRSCGTNGTWSGAQPVCAVDSILPKAYLVILIVGATVAVFLACIPYDFYRFRKRKKKVRDHQERLSLVTRIAPGHAKVVLETVPADDAQPAQPHPRRFGLKSLFSVFRFVGGKMKTHGHVDATNHACSEEHGESEEHLDPSRSSSAAHESDAATASSCIFSPHRAPSCPSSDDILDLSSEGNEDISFNKYSSPGGEITPIPEEIDKEQRSYSNMAPTSNDPTGAGAVPKKGLLMFQRANEIFSKQLAANRQATNSGNSRRLLSAENSLMSEPATVEVTSIDMNQIRSQGADNPRGSPQGDEFPSPKITSPASSSSSPDVASLRRGDSKTNDFRTFHFPSGVNSIAYHSMPTISDIP